MRIRVVIVDDHGVVREGLRLILESRGDIEVVGEARDGVEGLSQIGRLQPDVVIMDIAMPGLNGIDAAAEVGARCAKTKLVILSMYATWEHVIRAFKAGARGFVIKESAGKDVVDAVYAVHNKQLFLSRKLQEVIGDEGLMELDLRMIESPLASLSRRERAVLQLVVEGKSSAEAGRILGLSPKTVDTYRSRLMQKLRVPDFASLVRFAVENGLTPIT